MKNGVRVLIVEDSHTQAEQRRFPLELNGYQVSTACNGKEALALMNSCKPTIVISEIVMPEMYGYELCRQIRAKWRKQFYCEVSQSGDHPMCILLTMSLHLC
jgi:CheY-like chemotaxis protein